VKLLAALLAAFALIAPAARADGDPASDTLIVSRLFLPYQVKFSKAQLDELNGTIAKAKTKGFPIRVALIAHNFDLGTAGLLYRKPQTYAQFLAQELAMFNTDYLLVVMPNGYGAYHCKGIRRADGHVDPCEGTKPIKADQEALAGVATAEKNGDMAAAATEAIKAVAAEHGAKLGSSRTPLVIGAVAVVLGLLAGALLFRRARRSRV
jgi:hypothetical protein